MSRAGSDTVDGFLSFGDLGKEKMSNSRISTKDLKLKPDDGSAEDPEAFLKYIKADSVLMNKLLQIDHELHEVVLGNKIDTLQQLLVERHNRCHCRSSYRFELFLGHLREEHDPSYVKKPRTLEVDWKGTPESAGVHGRGSICHESLVKIYVEIEVNGFPVKADIRTGSSTIISKSMAEKCGLPRVDDGDQSVHCISIKIGKTLYNFSLPILDSADFDFIFGLNMLTEFQCIADLKRKVLKVGDEEVTIHLDEEAIYFPEDSYEAYSSGTAPHLYTETEDLSDAAATSGASTTTDLRLNSDGSAVDPAAFLQCIQEDSELMAELFQIPELVNVVGGNDINELQDVLRKLCCDCSHCIRVFLFQSAEDLKRFYDNEAVRKHYGTEQAPYVLMTVGYGIRWEVLVDSGANSTIMSKSLADRCGLLPGLNECCEFFDDEGRPNIIGHVKRSFIKINNEFYKCPLFVLDSTDEFFVLGLDMMCELQCTLDFKQNILEVGDGVKASILLRRVEDLCTRPPKRPRQDISAVIDENYSEKDAKELKIKVLMDIMRITREEALGALDHANWVMRGAFEFLFS